MWTTAMPYSLGHRRPSLKASSSSKCWYSYHHFAGTSKYDRGLSHLLHAELHCSTTSAVHCCLPNKAPQSLVDCCTPVWVTSICEWPAASSCLCHNTDVRCSAAGPSLLLDQQPGTCCQTVYETRHVQLTAFGVILTLSFLGLLAYTVH